MTSIQLTHLSKIVYLTQEYQHIYTVDLSGNSKIL